MRRGRTLIYVVLLFIVIVAVGGLYLWSRNRLKTPASAAATPTVQIQMVNVVTASQTITAGRLITQEMLGTIQIPDTQLPSNAVMDPVEAVNKYARQTIQQGDYVLTSMLSATANVNLQGSVWSTYIPSGLTAISIPVSRLSSAAYSIRDGDHVNVIVSMLIANIDPATQSLLPNMLANIETDPATGTVTITQGDVIQGHFELDEISNMVIYIQPSEPQRPRLVTQMIMQNVQVLHMGTFALPGEAIPEQFLPSGGATATPVPANEAPAAAPVVTAPDVVTLMVTPQDAVTLTYLVYSGVQITLTLRNPGDTEPVPQPDSADLMYLLTQYNINPPVPLSYALQPRLDELKQPVLGNDAPITP